MKLTQAQRENIAKFIPVFQEYLESADGQEDQLQREDRKQLYKKLLSPDGLYTMTELEFGQVMSSLWASQMWGNKSYLVDKLLRDNDLSTLRIEFQNLLWGSGAIASRYNKFRKVTNGFGTATISELLAFCNPDEYGVWTDRVRKGLNILGLGEIIPFVKKPQLSGLEYEKFNQVLAVACKEIQAQGIMEIDLLGVNYFLFEVWRSSIPAPELAAPATRKATQAITAEDFDHDDVIDKLVAMGAWLGFEAEKEKNIATGARVDVVWQARIANLGVVTYVFEVQRKGSIDSLILNLQKAQNNPSVQRLVVVASEGDLTKIRKEVETLPESFRKAMSYMEVSEALTASELLSEFTTIIDKLNLVQSEFSTTQ
ncbi:MAG: hypothetical protein AB1894_16140 [Chloroflexota bacterium]